MRVLIIEDDSMVAMIHKEYFNRKEIDFTLDHVSSLKEAELYLESNIPDLVVLDNYLSDGKGVSLLSKLKKYPVVMITAANDIQTVEAALSSGVVDYLVKPFTYERFSQAIDKVLNFKSLMSKEKVNQEMLDDYLSITKEYEDVEELPKGLSKITLKKIVENLLSRNEGFNTQQIADDLDISRITIRKYLNYMVNMNVLSEDAEYSTSGRPVSIFNVICKDKLKKLL